MKKAMTKEQAQEYITAIRGYHNVLVAGICEKIPVGDTRIVLIGTLVDMKKRHIENVKDAYLSQDWLNHDTACFIGQAIECCIDTVERQITPDANVDALRSRIEELKELSKALEDFVFTDF